MDFLSQTYIALRGPTGAPQSAQDTIAKLSDRLSPSTLLADRRAAVLALKGLARDCKEDVGERALPGLLEVLQNDAEIDAEIAKAVLETITQLCEPDDDSKDLALKHTDYVIRNEQAVHVLFSLLGDAHFYTRYATLQLLSVLLQNRRSQVQGYFLKAPAGTSSVIAVLEDKREIIRNESIVVIQMLISQSPDIQKVLAFQGAFEKLFNTVTHEGGLEGGVISQDALRCVDSLLRYNSSNQSYFRETSLPSLLCSLLLLPSNLSLQDPVPQEFALQFWDSQKVANVSLVLGIMGMLVGSKGSSQELSVFVRGFVELALASNAPTPLKTQALHLLPSTLTFPLSEVILTPYMPVPETRGEEWDRLEPASALDALVELALHGEYNGLYSDNRAKEGLELRSAAITVFDNFVRKEDIRQAIVQGMLPPQQSSEVPMISPLLHSLCLSPSSPLNIADVTSTHLATLLFAHLLAGSSRAKTAARSIKPSSSIPGETSGPGTFFVPADNNTPAPTQPEEDEEDAPQSLLHLFSENLSLCFLSRSRAENDREEREWNRLIVGYICLLAQWLWDDPKATREFLEAGGLGTLVEPINQTSESEDLIPGLCAFLLGICYEFNREPGEITRATIHPIISRLGIDVLLGHMSRVREHDWFKSISPESMVLRYPTKALQNTPPVEQEGEIWLDWSFVDFWKSNQHTIQRGLATDPSTLASSSGPSAESAMLINSLKDVIRSQVQEIDALQLRLKELSVAEARLAESEARIAELEAELQTSDGKKREVEKEQEDLLVLLDDMSTKRRRDKQRMREAGMEVSEDEADDDDEDEDEDEGGDE
ncbi:p115 like vesicle tethering protein [Suillus discolor]|uniref:P115 like vesicle tethering protein n=1 Tax=Suillus discolor TaxID=1912936 RepID=A0A9P7FDX5_9AGAM|nr:p115 like vesicle tethering protein [Suillus discolor]KAG2113608.1 p115 like vesicle tethering protein [Suillus discolor]